MVRTSTPATLVRRRARALLKALPGALDGDRAALHRARVASRRLRELIPLLDAVPRRTPQRVRKLTRALGRVRELDVALALLDGAALRGTSHLATFTARQRIEALRDARRLRMLRRLRKLGSGKLEHTIEALVEIAEAQEPVALRRRLSSRMTRRARRLSAAVEDAGALYVPERLHAVRIAAKKLRYAIEIAAELGARRAAPLALQVRRVQITLGELQDRRVLLRELRAAAGEGSDGAAGHGLVTLAAEVERQAHELHGRYLAERSGIASAVAALRPTVIMDLLTASKPRTLRAAWSRTPRGSSRSAAGRG